MSILSPKGGIRYEYGQSYMQLYGCDKWND